MKGLSGCMGLAFLACVASGEDWLRFRGPNGQGRAEAVTSPATFTATDYKWKVPVPGSGYSHPVVSGEKLFVTSAEKSGANRMVICMSVKDGKTLWTQTYDGGHYRVHNKNNFASGTPALTADRLFVAFATDKTVFVVALNHAGEEIWRKDLGPYQSMHGFGPSVMVHRGKVVMQLEQAARKGPSRSFVIALAAKDGETVWKTPLKASHKAAYSTPCVATVDEREVLLMTGFAHGLYGVDPKDGSMIWQARVLDQRAVASPVIAGELMIGSSGSGGGGNLLAGVKMGGVGDVTATHAVFSMKRSASYVPTPVVLDGRLYTVSDRGGIASCVDAATGKPIWQERLGGDYSASPVIAGDRVYFVDESGVVTILQAGDSFKKLGGGALGDRSYCTPAIANGRLYFRTWGSIICL